MSDIFISYASKDRKRIMPLVHALESTGWSLFWDRTIPIGKTWRQVLDKELDDFGCMIVAWSKNSVGSDWVCEEAEEGKQAEVLFPVFIDDVRPPRGFGSLQAANLVGWDGNEPSSEYEMLLKGLSDVLGRPPAEKQIGTGRKVFTARINKPFKTRNKENILHLRSEPKQGLTREAVAELLKEYDFFCSEHAFTAEYCNPQGEGIENKFRVEENGLIVVDDATGLIWTQSESSKDMTFAEARAYVKELNQKNFAGYHSWRLPTLPEAMSLMTKTTVSHGQYSTKLKPIIVNLAGKEFTTDPHNEITGYISSEFHFKKDRIWTSDKLNSSEVWDVNFRSGYCYLLDVNLAASVVTVCKNSDSN